MVNHNRITKVAAGEEQALRVRLLFDGKPIPPEDYPSEVSLVEPDRDLALDHLRRMGASELYLALQNVRPGTYRLGDEHYFPALYATYCRGSRFVAVIAEDE